ncbi:unnamed protein product [Allacma fusca]|uniref:Uncharacterized protein n=1 Tax=Allacma fusca TaxID=39272 RepID=A0A8J2K238_9HEXA|nr:unnamed protein product [Allacma fusca]
MKLFAAVIALFLVAQSSAQICDEGWVLCEGTESECVPEAFICDGTYIDCSNGWDETGCPCPPGQWKCPNTTQCISERWICDTDRDCPGGEDEIDCPDCPGFLCNDGLCLRESDVCDGSKDCVGGEDEVDCPPCSGFECSGGRCIPGGWECDGEWDCEDDEANCTCSPTEFKCDDGLCIPGSWECDDYPDCRDESDERSCSRLVMPGKQPLVPGLPSSKRVPIDSKFNKLSKRKIKRDQKKHRVQKARLSCSKKMGSLRL